MTSHFSLSLILEFIISHPLARNGAAYPAIMGAQTKFNFSHKES